VNARWPAAARVAGVVLAVLYPPIVWFALTRFGPRGAALTLLACVLVVALVARPRRAVRAARTLGVLPFVTAGALGLAALLDAGGLVLAVPAFAHLLFLVTFGATLRPGAMPMVERFARLELTDPTPAQLAWCRMWTWIWCGFFAANAAVVVWLAAANAIDAWAFHTGFLGYVLCGVLFAVEFVLRKRRFGDAPRGG
jgi:uncharacterized membrane protein